MKITDYKTASGKKIRNSLCVIISLFLMFITPVYGYCDDSSDTQTAEDAAAAAEEDTGSAEEKTEAAGEKTKVAVDIVGKQEGFSAKLYDNTNGLPTSEANTIAETSEGFIWIGSYSGLIRYDGNTFERVDSTTGIASVVSLYADTRNRLWIGTNDNGLAMLERGEYTYFGREEGLKSASVRAITEDDEGNVYAATTSGIAIIDPDLNLHPIDDERIIDTYFRDIRPGVDGRMYGLTEEGGIVTLEDGQVVDFLSAEEIRVKGLISFLPDPENPGSFYLGTDRSEVYYGDLASNFSDLKTYDISLLTYIEHFEYLNGQIWILAGDGLGVLDDGTFYKLSSLPMNNSLSRMMTDYEGNLWFTSTRMGVMKIVFNRFADVNDRFNLEPEVVNSTCVYGNELYVAGDDGLSVLGGEGNIDSLPLTKAVTASGVDVEATDLIEYLDQCRLRNLFKDSEGRLWICTWRKYGLLCYKDGELTVYSEDDGMYSDRVRAVCETEDGTILAACTGGVNIIKDGKVVGGYGVDAGIVNTEVLTVAVAGNGDILMGTDGGGIYIVQEGSDTAKHISHENGLTSEVIMRIKYDEARDLFWIVSSNSIGYLTADYQVNTIHDFPYSNNFDLYENSKGEQWILASNGIYIVPTDELLANETITPVYYGMDNGLPCMTTANSYSYLTEGGELFIAGTTGVVHVNIDESVEDVTDLKVAVPYVDADNERIYPDANGVFQIPSGIQKLTVYSFVFNYSLINPTVTYHLEGFEDTKTTVSRSELKPIDYTNLRGGTYQFVMELRDSLEHSDKVFSVTIVKEKAFYEEIWFYIIVIALIILALALGVRFYIHKKTQSYEKKQQENMMFVTEITESFAKVIDMKDKYTNGHSSRVAKYTAMLARELGYDEETVEKYYRIALLHDIGKIGVPSKVLNKPGKLTDEEFETIKSHTTLGHDALINISIMPELAIGAGFHHERPDGRGYPKHLKGDEIPRVAQIIGVADCFDAMYSNRPYRNRMNFDKVISIIKEVSGTQLTEDVVEAFLRLVDRGEFRDPEDTGGGTTENIVNVKE